MAKNLVVLSGLLGKEIELKELENGKTVCNFSIAESYPTSKKDEKDKTIYETRWHEVTAWEGLAKMLFRNAKKGSVISLSGRLDYDNYSKDGVEVKKAKIIAESADVYSLQD